MGRSKSLKNKIALLLPPAFWLGVWQLGAFLVDRRVGGRGNELLLPYPVTVARALIRLGQTGEFWQTVLVSLGRILAGMGAGTLLGAVLAAAACASPGPGGSSPCSAGDPGHAGGLLHSADPAVDGRTFVPGVIAGLMVLPVVWGNLCRGIRETDPKLLELAAAYRFSWWKRVRLIYLPSLRPYFLAAVTTAMGLAWKSGVAAEVLCIPRPAIGTQIYNSKLYLDIPDLFAWTVAVVALSLLLEGLLRALLERDKRREDGA